MKKLIFVLLAVFCLVGCGANVNSTEMGTEENMTVHYEAMKGVQSYKFAKPDGDYSEIKVSKELNVTSEQVAQTFNLKSKGVGTMALSRYEQAKIMILGGAYVRETLERQLTTYLRRGYLTQTEYDELIALMDARELVTEEEK